jgi:hypothetical protein
MLLEELALASHHVEHRDRQFGEMGPSGWSRYQPMGGVRTLGWQAGRDIFVWLLIKGTVQLEILKELHLLLYIDKDYSTVPKYQKILILRNRGSSFQVCLAGLVYGMCIK